MDAAKLDGLISASLVRSLDENAASPIGHNVDFDLVMGWSDSDSESDSTPLKKARTQSTDRCCEKSGRSDVSNSKNTAKNDVWASNVFQDWVKERNVRFPDSTNDQCPENILETSDAEQLARYLSWFVIEVRKRNGSRYPPSTIHLILCGLQRIMRLKNAAPFDIFSKRDVRFNPLHKTMESVFQQLHNEGVGTVVQHTSIITATEEASLWAKGVLGDHSPLSLVRAVFYLNSRNFCLRGGRGHRGLKLSQLKRENDHWKFTYEPANRGGAAGSGKKSRTVLQYRSPSAGRRCHVYLLDLYVSKLPPDAATKDVFYLTPVKIPLDPHNPWFSNVPLGWNKLDRFVKTMFAEAGVQGKTNRSLQPPDTTTQGTGEEALQAHADHRTSDAHRVHESASVGQHKQPITLPGDLSNTLYMPIPPISFVTPSPPPLLSSVSGTTGLPAPPQLVSEISAPPRLVSAPGGTGVPMLIHQHFSFTGPVVLYTCSHQCKCSEVATSTTVPLSK